MEHGKGKLSVQTILTWEFEKVPYVDNQTPWGLRIRPQGEEGWLFVSFCPQGIPGNSEDETNRLQIFRPQYAPFGGYVIEQYSDADYDSDRERKPDACWEYRLYRCSFGDYVIFNKGADFWMLSHKEELKDTLLLCAFQGDPE